jgi:hypothetical protein
MTATLATNKKFQTKNTGRNNKKIWKKDIIIAHPDG